MLPVPFEVVPSPVNTLLPAFLQVLKAAGECFFWNACELRHRSRLNSLDILISPSFDVNALFKSDVHSSNSKNRHWQGTRGFPPRPAA
jgi:hypothetical protein